MFLIAFKKGSNSDKSKIDFSRPFPFSKANDMFMNAISRYHQTGQKMKFSYKIIDIQTGENVFNSIILIDHDTSNLYQIIKANTNAPKDVIDYVSKVENGQITESTDAISLNSHVEEKARLEQLKAEKDNIFHQLKKGEKEQQQHDMEFQKQMKDLQNDIKNLEKATKLKEKEASDKELQHIAELQKLKEERAKAIQLMEEKQSLEKQKKEEHEQRLSQVDQEAQKAELELASIEAELEKKKLERQKELQDIEQQKAAANKKSILLKAEENKHELEYQQEIKQFSRSEEPMESAIAVPGLTLKERLQELDFQQLMGLLVHGTSVIAKGSVNGCIGAYKLAKKYQMQRLAIKKEKLKILSQQTKLEEQVTLGKMAFMEELKKERVKQDNDIRRETRQKVKEAQKQARIEARYIAEMKKRPHGRSFYHGSSFKFFMSMVILVVIACGSIRYFHLENTFPALNPIENAMDAVKNFVGKLGN